jgi:pyruvate dehydrogenase E1 component
MAVIVLDGLRRMFFDEEDVFYYITLMNENYEMPILPMQSRGPTSKVSEAIARGMYLLSERDVGEDKPRVQLLGSGAILREALRAQEILADEFQVASNVYSVTSYKALYEDGRDCERWNRLHPGDQPRRPHVAQVLEGQPGPVVAASDYVTAVGRSIAPYVPGRYVVLGTDGFGRSEARAEPRRFFEVDAENIVLAALSELAREKKFPKSKLKGAIKRLGLDPQKPNPATV